MDSSVTNNNEISFKVMDDEQWNTVVQVTPINSDDRNALNELTRKLESERAELDQNIDKVTVKADKLDYLLAASSGILTGLVDIFLVGSPGNSKLQNFSNEKVDDLVKKFAQGDGWKPKEKNKDNVKSAIGHLERKYGVPYDLRGTGDMEKGVTSPWAHHFDSLAHHPTPVGLFFSIIDQFAGQTSFISGDSSSGIQIVSVENQTTRGKAFKLLGDSVSEKFFCGIVNWFGHIMSDVAGSSGAHGAGAGIPGPILSMVGDFSALLRMVGLSQNKFEKIFFELSREMYSHGFDARFELAQAVPVIINELLIRLMYMIRRLYVVIKKKEFQNIRDMWNQIKPFGNVTVKRMILVGAATFTALDIADAAIRSAKKSVDISTFALNFVLHINVVGIGRLIISASGEVITGIRRATYRNQRILVMQKLLMARHAQVQYQIMDVWEKIPETVKALEIAEVEIQKYYLASMSLYNEYDEKIRPELEKSINVLSEEDKREFLDFLE